jgi:predicted DNA-binding transcriptional regulator YafY
VSQLARALIDDLARDPVALERYVTAGELAELMGVSVSTVKRMVRAGMPSETWGMSRTRRYLPSQAVAWASARGTITGQPGRRANATRARQPKE